MLRELISWPISTARAVIGLPRSMERSIREANELIELSRQQLEVMRRQADQALEQADRMNEMLARVVRLTEPLERAQRGGEYVGQRLKEAIFGAETPPLSGTASHGAREAGRDVEAVAGEAAERQAEPEAER